MVESVEPGRGNCGPRWPAACAEEYAPYLGPRYRSLPARDTVAIFAASGESLIGEYREPGGREGGGQSTFMALIGPAVGWYLAAHWAPCPEEFGTARCAR